jgi:hypothetical protein
MAKRYLGNDFGLATARTYMRSRVDTDSNEGDFRSSHVGEASGKASSTILWPLMC